MDLVSRDHTIFMRKGVIAFSIGALFEKGLGEFTVLTRTEANRLCWALIECT